MLKNFWFQAHWLIGITAGVVLAVVGLTGGILSFETEIQDWLNRDVRRVAVMESAPLSPAALVETLRRHEPEKTIQSVQVFSEPGVSARVTFAPDAARGGEGGGGRGGPRGETRYVNPYTGALIEGKGTTGQGFFRGTRSLHRWLTLGEFGSQAVGRQLVGASTLLCVVLALSGLYLRWPRRAGNWRTWLTFDPLLKGRSFLWHLHAILGTWVLVGFLLMCLTGLTWSYGWYRDAFHAVAGVERPAARGGARGEGVAPELNRRARLAEGGAREGSMREGMREGGRREAGANPGIAIATLETAWKTFSTTTHPTGFSSATLNLPRQPGKPIEIRYLDATPAHERANNTLSIDAATGAVLKHDRYDTKRFGEKIVSSIFPLHSGSFFGLPGVVLYMIASLAMPVFAITGWMLYLDRRRKKRAARAAEGAVAGSKSSLASGSSGASSEPLLLGFASQAGFARELAWQTAGSLQAAGIPVEVHPLERLDRQKLGQAKRALFVVSTFGEGEPPDAVRSFARHEMNQKGSLSHLKFGVLALGDRQYQTFCAFGRTLDRWLHAQGAQPLFPTVEVDKGDPKALGDWRTRLGALAEGAKLTEWKSRPFQSMNLVERQLLNPGSAGAPTYHIELAPDEPCSWSAGDIAEIQIGNADEAGEGALPVREFSIASVSSDGHIHLLVRQARKANGSIGIGTAWLTMHMPVGGSVAVRVRENPSFHSPAASRPMILIGNGTGIAGLRSHLRARCKSGASRNWLIFGERNRAVDFYYETEIKAWQSAGALQRVDLAFSRDQSDRRYVQHCLRENADLLREWVADGAAIYVCGSAEGMAGGVHSALVDILGEQEIERMRDGGLYRRDVY